MGINDFINELNNITPTREDLVDYNLSPEETENLIKSFQCTFKPYSKPILNINDPIVDLFSQYDCSNLTIGLLSFQKEILETENYYQISKLEIDLLVIDKITRQILVVDYESPDFVIWKCAANSTNFMEAILICAHYFSGAVSSPFFSASVS
jgi:hypothetical protein